MVLVEFFQTKKSTANGAKTMIILQVDYISLSTFCFCDSNADLLAVKEDA